MHKYLRAIGFSGVSDNDELRKLLELSVEHNDAENIFDEPDKKKYGELKKAFAPGLGICSRGQVQKEYFEFEYYYPYLEGRGVTTFEDVYVERQAEKECYIGACDDNRVGVTIIFYLQNMVEYLQVCGTQPGNHLERPFCRWENYFAREQKSGTGAAGQRRFPEPDKTHRESPQGGRGGHGKPHAGGH